MRTEVLRIAKKRHNVLSIGQSGFLKITPKDPGECFAGDLFFSAEDGMLTLSYPDGTSVALTNI